MNTNIERPIKQIQKKKLDYVSLQSGALSVIYLNNFMRLFFFDVNYNFHKNIKRITTISQVAVN